MSTNLAVDYLTKREELQRQLEALQNRLAEWDQFALKLLAEYAKEPGVSIPCGPLDHPRPAPWEVTEVDAVGIHFKHDCRDHGYDLPCTESCVIPIGYVTNPEGWRAKYAVERQRQTDAREEEARNRRRRVYEELKAEFEGSS